MRSRKVAGKIAGAASMIACATLFAQQPLPRELQGVGVEEHLNQAVDLNLTFTAENGYPVALRDFFHQDKPVLVNLVYYSCPMLCTMVLNGQTAALRELAWTPGREFEVVTISIDPKDTFDLARKKRASYIENYGRPAPGWHFLTSDSDKVKKLADQLGFHYRYVEAQAQYAHPAAIMVLTPEGRISRYLYGIHFNPRDVRLALTEAAQGRFGLSDRILLYCFHYDPQARGYVLFAANLMRAAGALTVVLLVLILGRLWRREPRARREEALAR
jgi:protein SCO1/2